MEDMMALRNRDYEVISSSDENEESRE